MGTKFSIKYVLSELLIVIAGILIAFTLNNWAQSRSDKKQVESERRGASALTEILTEQVYPKQQIHLRYLLQRLKRLLQRFRSVILTATMKIVVNGIACPVQRRVVPFTGNGFLDSLYARFLLFESNAERVRFHIPYSTCGARAERRCLDGFLTHSAVAEYLEGFGDGGFLSAGSSNSYKSEQHGEHDFYTSH